MADNQGTAIEQPADDIRSALAAAVAEAEKPVETKVEKTEPEAESVEAKTETKAEGTRPRDESGKFAKADDAKNDEKPVEGKAPEAEKAAKTDDKTTKAPEAPAHWSEADKTRFKNAPDDLKSWLLDRHKAMEADYTRKTQEIAEFKREYDPVDKLFTPHREVMKAKGFTPSSLITAWFNVEKALMEGKGVDIIKSLVPAYKIDVNKLADALGLKGAAAPSTETKPDAQPPAEQAPWQKELDEIKARLAREDEEKTATIRRQREQEAQGVMTSITEFEGAKDDKGELLHPYFKDVENAMSALAAMTPRASGQSTHDYLKALYDQAVWANPSTRQKLQESQRAAEQAQRQAEEQKARDEARAKAEKAKRAGSSVTGAPGAGQSPASRTAQARSLREELEAAAADAA